MHIAAHFCRLYLSFIEKSDKFYLLKWLQFGRLLGIYSRKEVYKMSLKKLLADALFLDARVYHYRSCGYDEASAYALASQDLAEQQRASAARVAEMERLEKSREHYRESMAALEERRRKLREENQWIYEEAEKFRQEAIRIREEAKNRDNDQAYSRGYAVSLRPQFSPFTAGNGIIKRGYV